MGATAALCVVGKPIHIGCDRNPIGLSDNSHAQNAHLYFQNTSLYMLDIYKRYNHIRIFAHQAWPNEKVFLNFVAMA